MKKKNNSDRSSRCSAKRIIPFLGGVLLCMPTSASNHEVGRLVQEKHLFSSDDENGFVVYDVIESGNEEDNYNPTDCHMGCSYTCQFNCQGSCNATCSGGCAHACTTSCQLSSSGEMKQTKTDSQEPLKNTVKEKPTKKSKKKKKK